MSRLLKYLSKLVSLRTDHTDKKVFTKNANTIIDNLVLLNNHLKVKVMDNNGFPALVMYSKSYTNPKLVLQAHLDVVPAHDDMFSLKFLNKINLESTENHNFPNGVNKHVDSNQKDIKNLDNTLAISSSSSNIVRGRGVMDMKFAIACYMQLMEDLDEQINDLDLAIWITSDEEIGGFNGINILLNELKLMPQCVFLPDGSKGNCISTAAKGIIQFEVELNGKSSHASRPWEGNNAITLLFEIYQRALKLPLFQSIDDGNHWNNSLTLTMINGGTAPNQVPSSTKATFDCRFTEELSVEEVERKLNNFFSKHNCIFKRKSFGPHFHTPKDNPFMESLISILNERDYRYDFVKDHGASDARFFSPYNIPIIMFMPEGGGSHGDTEWLDIAKLEDYYSVMKEFVLRNAKTTL